MLRQYLYFTVGLMGNLLSLQHFQGRDKLSRDKSLLVPPSQVGTSVQKALTLMLLRALAGPDSGMKPRPQFESVTLRKALSRGGSSAPQGFSSVTGTLPPVFLSPPNCLPLGFLHSSVGKESTCSAGDPSLIPGSGRSPGEGIGYPLQYSWVFLVAQPVKNLPAMREIWV